MSWGESEEAYRQVQQPEKHEGHLSHQLIAGAGAFAGFKAWEEHQRKEGKPVEHANAKAALAAFATAGVERLIETKGLDKIDEHKAKKQAEENAHRMYEEHYERGHNAPHYNPQEHPPHPSFENHQFGEHPRPKDLDRW
ncbi:hypothetical protein BDV33DRAFT_205551 [Aspergillus novoparasiticus]|uniref:CipC-like antibiotic response protein n=1 Tax=Aspergillus novoparasiticus TaxID=986946 RepID=A0A5N6ELT4_9EURO|nr:hypothetical protein BDV33DRAFT_205551 [Aspergillus novoparasiticus]